MRAVEFRAWDIDKQEYITWFEIGCEGCVTTQEPNCSPDYPNVILEQYTGLKDKNGKKIYEGDVVQCYDPRYKSTDKRFGGPSVVDRFYSDIFDYEILGNIHENPELCGKKKAEEAIKFIAKLNRVELKRKEQ